MLMHGAVTTGALAGRTAQQQARANLVSQLQQAASQLPVDSFSVDEAIEGAQEMPERAQAPYGLEELGYLLDRPSLLPPGTEAGRVSTKEVFWTQPGAPQISVTTDADFFEEHPESVEFWSPGSPAFPEPLPGQEATAPEASLGEVLRVA